jgi:hypothetical protein
MQDEKKQSFEERSWQEQLHENEKRHGTNLMKKGRDHGTTALQNMKGVRNALRR